MQEDFATHYEKSYFMPYHTETQFDKYQKSTWKIIYCMHYDYLDSLMQLHTQ